MCPEVTFLIDIEAATFFQRRAYRLNPDACEASLRSWGPQFRLVGTGRDTQNRWLKNWCPRRF